MLPAQSSEGVTAVFPLTMELVKVMVPPKFQMPPPLSVAVLPAIVACVILTVPNLLKIPPPLSAVFPLMVLLVMNIVGSAP